MHASRSKKEKPKLLSLIHSTPVEKRLRLFGSVSFGIVPLSPKSHDLEVKR